MKRVMIKAIGRVQGVGFRWFVKQTAEHYQITGWVQNQWDGSVWLAVQGAKAELILFFQAIQHKHPYARVDSITSQDRSLVEDEEAFYIRG